MNVDRKVLPISTPIVTSYPDHTNYLSILATNSETLPWLYSNYIQIFCRKNLVNTKGSLSFTLGEEFTGRPVLACPWIRTTQISNEMINDWDIVDFLIWCIDKNYYVEVLVNQYYLGSVHLYQRKHYAHTLFVFGYDKYRQVFMTADFVQIKGVNVYKQFESSFEDIRKSYSRIEETTCNTYVQSLNLMKLEKRTDDATEFKYTLDRQRIANLLREYLDIAYFNTISMDHANKVYGIHVYDELRQLCQVRASIHGEIDNRPFHVLHQHKLLMRQRIRYLVTNGILQLNEYLSSIERIEAKAKMISLCVLKYQITGRKKLSAELPDQIRKLQCEEFELYKRIADCISNIKSPGF